MGDLFAPTIARTYGAGTQTAASDKTKETNGHTGFVQNSSSDNLTLTMQDFLQLMIVQFQNQDMDNPASTSDMMNQLMQMSTIQAMATVTDASTMAYSASLVGKTVTVGEFVNGKLNEVVGTVTGSARENGEQVIFVDGKKYKLNSIMAVGKLPPVDEKPPVEEKPDGGTEEKPPVEGKPDESAPNGGTDAKRL
ncbi:flagellar hook capping FlgD N-terminal domain-containing protein [Agathobaculum desmolans]|uniref:flagellar hook capping FlgD N-terminal domain-containing protein n=1 Tax=Agathobaculum desmolans TaxID=39484 RepID=UPI0004E27CA4|nr:flagellar hook capping FlgD N-terminal domain-containing protein [Agathobaculum desmolans]